ncbi:hypothetical protein P154DRAFT_525210 [Amniculicola lignicola CBS 123094]|uniref:ceramidase n=1 Tax=Amniculicola lignicola CBS 123094 TaxID=1392246 RepID=A0A6A5W595_9PLEO|nr:hypothetical protein P154DRAFT_525210 [Amniculicola lignicola CBS 123094]
MPPTTRSQTGSLASLTRSRDSVTHTVHSTGHKTADADLISIVPSDYTSSDVPPIYIIDLSLPPSQRYVEVAKDFKLILQNLSSIFDDLLEEVNLPKRTFHWICRILLHRLHSKEQTEELRGISKVIDIPMYLLIAYNVLLDLFMGCTSGGIVVKEPGQRRKMLHFRTLDWGMPELRKVIIQFEYKNKTDGPTIARSIGYAGFVGILTGARPGLSLSLNFRPYHNNDSSRRANFRFYAHQVLVLLGFRPSISSILRSYMLPSPCRKGWNPFTRTKVTTGHTEHVAIVLQALPSIPTTSCYITLSDGTHTCVLEKDLRTANLLSSTTFIAVTNHDVAYEKQEEKTDHTNPVPHSKQQSLGGTGMQDIVDESITRKLLLCQKWEKRVASLQQRRKLSITVQNDGGKGLAAGELEGSQNCYVRMEKLRKWLLEYPITNPDTHFVVVMDGEEGEFVWVRSFEKSMYEELEMDDQSIDEVV